MTDEEKDKWHKKMAVDCFNQTWDYMEMENRTADEDINMINATHAWVIIRTYYFSTLYIEVCISL